MGWGKGFIGVVVGLWFGGVGLSRGICLWIVVIFFGGNVGVCLFFIVVNLVLVNDLFLVIVVMVGGGV